MAFPLGPVNGQVYKNRKYDSATKTWVRIITEEDLVTVEKIKNIENSLAENSVTIKKNDIAITKHLLDYDVTNSIVNSNTEKVKKYTTEIGLNTAHRGSAGTAHTFIDQDVTTSGSPSFKEVNIKPTTKLGESKTLVPSQIAVKNYVDSYMTSPVGSIFSFHVYKDRTSSNLLSYSFDNAVSKLRYAALYAEVGDSFLSAHVAAGDPTPAGTLFYPTPIPDISADTYKYIKY